MRQFLSTVLVTALAAGSPAVLAGQSKAVKVTGTAYRTNLQPLPNIEVQLRSLQNGARVGTIITGETGEFTFTSVQPGSYVVEIVDSSGRLLGMSQPLVIGEAPLVKVSVVAVAEGAAAAAPQGAGFSLLGMGPVTSLAVIGAAGAASVTAIVATQPDASPSR